MRITRLAVAAACVAAAIVLPAVPAQAAPTGLTFTRIQYDPSGADLPLTNRQLDREWVTIRNTSTSTRQLKGLQVRDAKHHRYVFGPLALRPGRSVKLHTGPGRDTSTNVYWDSGYYIWNNDGDTATLASAAGRTLDTCHWSSDGTGSINC